MVQFLDLTNEVVFLDQIIRQDSNQIKFKELLPWLRTGHCTYEDEIRLRTLELNSNHYTSKEIKDIERQAIHLFANRKPKNDFNQQQLEGIANELNPVAVCTSRDTTISNKLSRSQVNNHLREVLDMKTTYLCRGAVVEITFVNLKPKLGLFNGARGTVVDLVFEEGDNPNAGDLPEVVVVDFFTIQRASLGSWLSNTCINRTNHKEMWI